MIDQPNAPYLFVIGTADYAGNFERELCAYITGRIGECEIGAEMATLFETETGQEPFENVVEEVNDHGCHRPATAYGPQGRSVAISFETKPTAAQIALMKERAAQFAALPAPTYGAPGPADPRISQILGLRLIKQTITRKLEETIL